jgi:AraC-like DNA-binding protein
MPEEAAVARVRSLVEENLWKLTMEPDGPASYDSDRTGDLAQKARVSKWHFHRVFKEVTGMTPAEYANQQRALRSGHPMLGDEILSSACGPGLTPNIADVLSTQYEEPSIDMDWEAFINDDAISHLIEAVTFNKAA